MWSPPEPQAHRSAFQATLGRLVPAKWGREAGCPQAWAEGYVGTQGSSALTQKWFPLPGSVVEELLHGCHQPAQATFQSFSWPKRHL